MFTRKINYFELNVRVLVADNGITFGAHLGKQTDKGTSTDNLVLPNSTTYTNRVQYTHVVSNRYLGKDAVVLSVTRSF